MALIDSFEKSGNWLFRYRGYIPVVLFIAAVPVIYFTDVTDLSDASKHVLTCAAIALSVLGFIIRAIAIGTTPKGTSGRNTKEGQVAESLNTKGIYSMVRHPLYLGNYFMWIGIVLFTFNFTFVLIVTLLFWLYYERIMFAEERFLERKFGDEYMNWAQRTPAFIACMRKYVKNEMALSYKNILKREYSGVLATVFGFVFIDDIRRYFEAHHFEPKTIAHYSLILAIIVALVLRSLKHYTKVFEEEGRA